MSSFAFSSSHLDVSIGSVFGAASYEKVGISRKTYQLCELVDINYNEGWEKKIINQFLAYYGYNNVDDFKEVYARAHIYNALRYSPEKTIKNFMDVYVQKVERFHSRKVDCDKSNLIDFLMSMSLEELFTVGW